MHHPDQTPLRILILSTPKSGNTWLARLLSSIYDVPLLGLVFPFDANQARTLGQRWVVFHHLRPTLELCEWIDEVKPVLITAVRHPADVLISLYHHLHDFQSGEIDTRFIRSMLAQPYQRNGIVSDASGSFEDDLECSLSWLRTGRSHVVRYENLWRDARQELTRLTARIAPVSEKTIDLAIKRCDFSLMRRLAGSHGRFFRSGQVGAWPNTLPPEICGALNQEPYRSLIHEFGYSMDPADPMIAAPRISKPSTNPFNKSGDLAMEEFRFDNGVPIAPIAVDLYLALSQYYSWKGDPCSAQSGSYYEWLNQPCELHARYSYDQIVITNLSFHLHRLRTDINQTFSNLQGPARADYADWFVRGGAAEQELDEAFIQPVRQSLFEWATARSPDDREAYPWWPTLPNFAVHLHRQSPELRLAYPDILCFDRWSYLEWIVNHHQEAGINPVFIKPVERSLKKLSKLRSVGRYLPGARVRVASSTS